MIIKREMMKFPSKSNIGKGYVNNSNLNRTLKEYKFFYIKEQKT